MIRTYTEMLKYRTFEERFRYLKLNGSVGVDTFGYDRYLNQMFYKSSEWRQLRNYVITRDNGCDLAIPDLDILDRIIVHHLNPLRVEDVIEHTDYLLDPNYLVCVSSETHRAIHYGDERMLFIKPIIRRPNDTCPWKK